MKIRAYSATDHQACVEILTSNVPDYFLATDVASFSAFVDRLPGPYYIFEDSAQTVAAGGWALDADGVADLTWAMVRRDLHRRGLGSELLRFRIQAISKETPASLVRVRTTQRVQGFFSRHGFRIVDAEVDGYGAGQDLVTMELNLPPGWSEERADGRWMSETTDEHGCTQILNTNPVMPDSLIKCYRD